MKFFNKKKSDTFEVELNSTLNGDETPTKKESDEDIPTRAMWGSKREFLLSCIGYTVGLGNVWRFPYLAYRSGGGAFLIPYITMLIVAGIPMYIMEVSLGQYIAEGPIQSWRIICPLTRGIGYAMLMCSFLVSIYYNVIIAWVLYYFFASFRKDVPWRDCNPEWASPQCRLEGNTKTIGNGTYYNSTADQVYCLPKHVGVYNITNTTGQVIKTLTGCVGQVFKDRVSPSEDYFRNKVLQASPDIGTPGPVVWELALCLLLAWIVVYFCMWKGVKSAGKVVYFTATFPYIVLFILLIRGLTLPGAADGIVFYIKPNFTKIMEPKVWAAAGSQLFYSLGPAFGTLLSYASYNSFNNNCIKDATFIACADCFTSTLAGFVIFSVLGYMAGRLNISIDTVVKSGPGLAFIVYPEGISRMPVSTLWALLFFFMLFTLGLDSQFGMMECIVTNLADEYPRYFRKYKEFFILGVCSICFLLGLSMVTQGGIYVFNLFDYQTAGVSLIFIALVEMITVGWLYGTDRLNAQLQQMIGYKPSIWWTFCWKYFSPLVLILVFSFALINWEGVSYRGEAYPGWAEFIGWMLALVTMFMIPLFMVIAIWETPGTWRERLRAVIQPNEEALQQKAKANGVQFFSSTSRIKQPIIINSETS